MAKLNALQLQDAIRDAGAEVYGITEGIWRFLDEYSAPPLGDKVVSNGVWLASVKLFDLLQPEELDMDEVAPAVNLYALAARATIAHFQTHHRGFPGPAFLCRGLKAATDRLLQATTAWQEAERERAQVTKEVG